MGIIEAAARHLRSDEASFVPALSDSSQSSWTLRDALLAGSGCDRSAGPLAYWEWQEIDSGLEEARQRISGHVGAPGPMGPERWANQKDRSLEEVLDVLDAAGGDGDVELPPEVTLRPWCDPTVVSRCRIPYIPLAAVVHAWTLDGGSLKELLGRYEIRADTPSWTVLEIVDEHIAHTQPADAVEDLAWNLRVWMDSESSAVSLASKWLWELTEKHAGVTYPELVDVAAEVTEELEAA